MGDLAKAPDGVLDDWDSRVQGGTKFIQKRWGQLLPLTKRLLIKDGFNESGSISAPLESWKDSSSLVYSLGLFNEAVKGSLPSKDGDLIPSFYMSDEVLQEARNLVHTIAYCDPEFARLALHACMKHQAANAASAFFYNGAVQVGVRTGWSLVRMSIAVIFFSVLLAVCIGAGITTAFQNDAFTSSLLAFVGMFSYGTLKNLYKPDEKTNWEIAKTNWSLLIYRDFHVGTAHGVERQLRHFLCEGIHVPSVLFDLCATVQQGTEYRTVVDS